MPIYEYLCQTCGQFDYPRSFEEVGQPLSCPTCGTESRRVYTSPSFAKTSNSLIRALDQSNKSAHEPAVVKRQHLEPEDRQPAASMQSYHGPSWQIGH